MEFFYNLSPIFQAILGAIFAWFLTAVGAGVVFFFKTISSKTLSIMLGFGTGVMLFAAFFSLLLPSIESSKELYDIYIIPPIIGIIVGALIIHIVSKFLKNQSKNEEDSWHKNLILIGAITIHNIPEGLAIGLAFASAAIGFPNATVASAISLSIAVGLQNMPEGTAVSVPMRIDGNSRKKSFFFGQLSGMIEPFSAIIGVLLFKQLITTLPIILAIASGAMIYVVVDELIPTSQEEKGSIATFATIFGFLFMMMIEFSLKLMLT